VHDIDQILLETSPSPLNLLISLAFGDLIEPDWKVGKRLGVHVDSFTGTLIRMFALLFI